ncbi:MAG: diguanylate cyclase [Desulfobacteraceae bacterium]|nr:MAG: diguanylate cyclase [Desulfobacteraceae bacterium]
MSSVTESILELCKQLDDDQLIDRVADFAARNGTDTYQAILKILSDVDMDPEQARSDWDEIVRHRQDMTGRLNRKISLITAMTDYYGAKPAFKNNFKMVDIKSYEKTVRLSSHDVLTGLYNKGYLLGALDQHLSLAQRNTTDLSLLFLDIDGFKEINDTYGHYSGDLLLKRVAGIIKKELRVSDIASRFGGDEFVILMPNTFKANALILSERLRLAINSEPFELEGTELQITVSGGVAGFPVDAGKADHLLNLADSALYRAKGAGKNTISLFKEDKRRFLRVKFNRNIQIKQLGFADTRILSGRSKDIAIGGILFKNPEPLPIGTRIQVSIPISENHEPLLLIGTVVRIETFGENDYDIGMILSFKEMEKTAQDQISQFLSQHSLNDS